jgi:hypothetical protein
LGGKLPLERKAMRLIEELDTLKAVAAVRE